MLALAPATILMGATLPTLTRQFAGDVVAGRSVQPAVCGEHDRGDRRDGRRRVRPHRAARAVGRAGGRAPAARPSPGSRRCGWVAASRRRRFPGAKRGDRAADGRDRGTDDIDGGVAAPTVAAATAPDLDRASSGRGRRSIPALALGVAFVSGLTSLGYQVTWTRLLASGTGNTTYVFTMILAMFLLGLAIGAVLFATLRTRLGDPIRLLAVTQIVAAVLATLGLVLVLVAAEPSTPNKWQESLETLFRSSFLVVLPVTIVLGVAFPASSALLPDEPPRRARVRVRSSRSTRSARSRGSLARAVLPDPARRVARPRRRSRGGQRKRRAPPRLEDVDRPAVARDGRRRRATETERPLIAGVAPSS